MKQGEHDNCDLLEEVRKLREENANLKRDIARKSAAEFIADQWMLCREGLAERDDYIV